jgi:Uma2 family endonuclease
MRYDAAMATNAHQVLLTVDEFLRIDFKDRKAELDNGIIRMMAGGVGEHNRVQKNVSGNLFGKLRGQSCQPYNSDAGLRTHDLSLRYPDVAIYCGRDAVENNKKSEFDDPVAVIEVLSPSTRHEDEGVKLREYQALPSVMTIALIDPDAETIVAYQRTPTGFSKVKLEAGADLSFPSLGIALAHDEIFGRA